MTQTIHGFDKATCRAVSDAAVEALQDVAKRFGLTVERRSGSYTDQTFTAKFEFKAVAKDGTDAEQATFNQYCGLFNLEPSDFGKTFTVNREVWTFAGLRMKRSKYPILARNVVTGKITLFTQDVVDRYLDAQKRERAKVTPIVTEYDGRPLTVIVKPEGK